MAIIWCLFVCTKTHIHTSCISSAPCSVRQNKEVMRELRLLKCIYHIKFLCNSYQHDQFEDVDLMNLLFLGIRKWTQGTSYDNGRYNGWE